MRNSQTNDSLLRKKDVERETGLSESTLWRLEKKGEFPPRVRISANTVGWWKSDINAWMDELKANSSETAA